jgi:hypothetical protein
MLDDLPLISYLENLADSHYQNLKGVLKKEFEEVGLDPKTELAEAERMAREAIDDVYKIITPGYRDYLNHMCDAAGIPLAKDDDALERLVDAYKHGLLDMAARVRGRAFCSCFDEELGMRIIDFGQVFAQRFQALSLMCRTGDLSWRAKHFLRRVGQSFLFGLDAECAIMCRVVLDLEFEAEIPNDVCVGVLGPPLEPGQVAYSLQDRIAVAHKKNRITTEGRNLANNVRLVGNRAAHGKLNSKEGKEDRVIELIKSAMIVIDELQRTSRNPQSQGS